MVEWWRCPNEPPCPHAGVVHDVEDFEDTRPTCCVEGCGCGEAAGREAQDPSSGGGS